MSSVIGLYRPGISPLHRLPAGVKLALLVVAGAGSVFVRQPWQVAVVVVVVAVGYTVARVPFAAAWVLLRPLLWLLVPLTVVHTLLNGWERAVVVVGVILALVLLANLVTLTTRTTDLVDTIVTITGPLRRVGVNPERVGLLLHLGIRAVPVVIELAGRVRDAQRARGLTASPRAFAVPLVVGALRYADTMGEALAARGFDD
ncbi:energy-coupling factor transporter transmembrane protein EcfT [Nocardioides sp.]|uniref:energy-coupling factor transporter transmembrane component T family protein n=1 Tax=Nocardioides sp. TaxID=35761 RepID=UPI002733FE84|nr:energy-coupling factor transporter transmembrane protein EcfT [Nocardioides sp.]MDP3892063.1 energy-coupling factor transporter transmembrane protein EcfT [Nocardioides sp.]